MGKPASYEFQIRKAMKESGIYSLKLELQIKFAANAMRVLDRLMAELNNSDIFEIKFSRGDETKELSPLIQAIQKQTQLVNDLLTALGMNFKAKASNVKDGVDAVGDDKLTDLLKSVTSTD